MRFSHVLPLAALSTALVLPSEEVLAQLEAPDSHRGRVGSWLDQVVETKDAVYSNIKEHADDVAGESRDAWTRLEDSTRSALDEAFDYASETAASVRDKAQGAAFDMQSWLSAEADGDPFHELSDDPHHGPPHHGPPHHGPPDHHPKHPPHHHKPNLTVYQMIAESKYTTKLAKLISGYDDLVEALNSTKANFTVFAPTDAAFAKIPEHAPKPSKEQLKAILSYHVVPDVYSARRVLSTHTVPTLLKSDSLGSEPLPQRLAFKLSFRGLTVNFYSRIVAVNIFATNGVIHGVDSIILPPPSTIKIIDLLPSEFSTLELGLGKTGLLEKLNTTDHAGGTFFAPSNWAFVKLGPKINAFLFSTYGQKYLKALLEYHVVPDNTLYSDAYYKGKSEKSAEGPEKGFFHVDLPTLLKDRRLSVDIARFGGFISIKINGFSSVSVQDGVAEDGVIHVVSSVLIPPKKVAGLEEAYNGEDLSVEDLMDRLEPFVANSDL